MFEREDMLILSFADNSATQPVARAAFRLPLAARALTQQAVIATPRTFMVYYRADTPKGPRPLKAH